MSSQFELFGLILTGGIIVTFLPALVSVITFSKPKAALFSLLPSFIFALYFSILEPAGLAAIAIFSLLCFGFSSTNQKFVKWLTGVSIFILAIAFMVHLIPGFNNPLVYKEVVVSENAVTYSKYLNLDKLVVAVLLLVWVVPKSTQLSWARLRASLPILATTTLVGLVGAVAFGLVELDAKLSPILIGWVITNLFITCYAEEAFFRGFIQTQLNTLFSTRIYGDWYTVFVSGLLFGIAHFPGGLAYTAIASVMGVGYAYVYQKTQNILVPIYAHFGFNLIHFCFFTYPVLV
ncbi:lysostaphin resistance A-like protein (plasmid) [Pseudoalteromonas sp. T1lg65]|uniref:CPBP family intramembrane glutamic endopeptidase n=1 Tax=Pseudoalteromonas sp. T1lg65 TaxID=2077101 RepID=UPI003F7AB229